MATTYIELTLRELLQIALGNPEISSTHLSLLQSFFDILLKKLDSRTEKIEIVGKMSTCMQGILRESRISPYPFDCAKVQIFAENLAKVEQLKERVVALENKLMAHFKQILNDEGKQSLHYSTNNFERFAQACESFCIRPEAEDALACKLVTNPQFIVHLIDSAISPLLREMDDKRKRLADLHAKFVDLKDRLNKALTALKENYKRCIFIEKLRTDFENVKATLEKTTSEIHNMLLAKLDKTELTFIKRKFHDQLSSVETDWNKLKTLLKREVEVKKDIGPHQCISCLGPIHCTREPAKPKPLEKCAEKKNNETRKEKKLSKIKTCAKVHLDSL
uniref:Polyhedral envelope protein n=1 Tax=Zeugodacus cucurbitae TaxID=28588 RepID=A0A0A1WHJ9_ZEUCU